MQQPGGTPYGVPPSGMSPFPSQGTSGGGAAPRSHSLTIDTLQTPPAPLNSGGAATTPRMTTAAPGFDEVAHGMSANFADDDAALAAAAAGEEAERGGASGSRWPRQETLALLKIRSEMDAAFRDATLKGPLWEEVSRKLSELSYKRSAKKCKEKFENVHKYYKRTKEGRAGRQDGKSYRFFSQLEALHSAGGIAPAAAAPAVMAVAPPPLAAASPAPISFSATMLAGSSVGRIQPPPLSAAPPLPMLARIPCSSGPLNIGGVSFSSNSSSSGSLSNSDEGTEEAGGSQEGRKRKRGSGGSSSGRKMMVFFEGLMKQVMERQEAMQQRFLETIEKREQDRMIREEAWRRQEMARLSREQELFAQERAMAASRDATLLSYIQKITGQSVKFPTMPVGAISVTTMTIPPTQPQPQQQPPPPQPPLRQQKPAPMPVQPLQQQPPPPSHHHSTEIVLCHQPPSGTEIVSVPEGQDAGNGTIGFEPASPSSSRWPKAEVHALIKIRSGLESRYQEAGPKGPLWEEISAGMKRIGYNRSSKRCKEKWENINKYFKKVKESNKKRPEDAKTCPYFHQLDALYRSKQPGAAAATAMGEQLQLGQDQSNPDLNPQERTQVASIIAAAAATQPPAEVTENNINDTNSRNGGNSEGGVQIQTSNGGIPPSFLEEGMKKPEDIVKELMDDYDKMEEADSDNMDLEDEDDEDDDEDNDERKTQYKIQFQRQNVGAGGGGNGTASDGANTSTTAAATTAAGSFMAMVK